LIQRTQRRHAADGKPAAKVLALTERIEAAIASCENLARYDRGKDRRGAISIGAVSTAKIFRAVRDLRIFESLPETSMSRSSSATGRRSARLLRGYDLDIAIMGRPPVDIAMKVHLIGDHPHVIIAPHRAIAWARKSHACPLSALGRRDFPDAAKPGISGTRGLMEQLFETANIRPKIGQWR